MNRTTARIVLAAASLHLGIGLVSCGGDDGGNPATPGGGADVTIQIVADAGSSAFSPNPDTVLVGQKVAWHNGRSVDHTSTADGGAWNTGPIGAGATSAAITMSAVGSFTYHCGFHPSMTGTLVVE